MHAVYEMDAKMGMVIELGDVGSLEVANMMARLTAELAARYQDDGAGDFKVEDLADPRSVFLVARVDGVLAGCGALRPCEHAPANERDIGEVKRMFVDPTFRGQGVGVAILDALEKRARDVGFKRVWLETGTMQPEALGLYRRAGYREIEKYGFYRKDPRSVCFEKKL